MVRTHRLIDHQPARPPYFLVARDLFAQNGRTEVQVKKIVSTNRALASQGTVVMAPGIACNSNLFRLKNSGESLTLDHDQSFANFLAAQGFTVYILNFSFTERMHNRYTSRFCPDSQYFQQRYKAPSLLTFDQLVNVEVPLALDLISRDSQSDRLSWIGYSLGGMLIYAYLGKHQDPRVQNVVTIGSPVSLNHAMLKLGSFVNVVSGALGFEERSLLASISEELIPLSNIIAHLPGWALKLNLVAPSLYNPANLSSGAIKAILRKVVEPIPAGLEHSFMYMHKTGFSSLSGDFDYLLALRDLAHRGINFLFFCGQLDRVAPPLSVKLAQTTISPDLEKQFTQVEGAGHLDLIVGPKAQKAVWQPTATWLRAWHKVA